MDIILKDPILTGVRILKHAEEYQNVMRRFLKGDEGVVTDVMYQTRKRWDLEGIYNCITTHTGFTLKDLVSYDGSIMRRMEKTIRMDRIIIIAGTVAQKG